MVSWEVRAFVEGTVEMIVVVDTITDVTVVAIIVQEFEETRGILQLVVVWYDEEWGYIVEEVWMLEALLLDNEEGVGTGKGEEDIPDMIISKVMQTLSYYMYS